jgi:hypothetical protein
MDTGNALINDINNCDLNEGNIACGGLVSMAKGL